MTQEDSPYDLVVHNTRIQRRYRDALKLISLLDYSMQDIGNTALHRYLSQEFPVELAATMDQDGYQQLATQYLAQRHAKERAKQARP